MAQSGTTSARAVACRPVRLPPCRALALRRRSRLQRGGGHRRHPRAPCAPGSRRAAARGSSSWSTTPARTAPPSGCAAGRRRAHPGPAQRRQPRQGLLGAPRHARGRAASCGCTATPTARRRSPRCRRCSRDRRGRRRRRRLAPRAGRARRPPPAAAAPDRRAHVRRALPRSSLGEPTHDLFCGFKLWRGRRRRGGLRARSTSTAGRSTPRRSRSPARWATACARSASCGATARARGCRCRAWSCPSSASCWRRARHVRRQAERAAPSPPPIRRRRGPDGSARTGCRSAATSAAPSSRCSALAALALRRSPGCCCASRCKRRPLRRRRRATSSLDQMQYLNWLRQAAEHVLVGNLYDLAPGPRTSCIPGC